MKIYLLLFFFLFPILVHSQTNCTILNCQNCSSEDQNNITCFQCDDGFYYDREQELCLYIFPCNQGEYKNKTNGICYPCSSDCANCYGPQDYHCTSCAKGSYLMFYNSYIKCFTCYGRFCDECDEVGDCITCPKGYWLNQTSGDCSPCKLSDCDNCDSNIETCDNCKFGFTYSIASKTCNPNSNCLLGFFNSFSNIANCQTCDVSCKNCFGPENSQCYECAYGYYFNNLSKCLPCNKNSCDDCQYDDEYCVACTSPLLLQGQDCVQKCSADEYYDELEQKCKKCSILCGTCLNSPDYCLTCADNVNYKYENNTCIPICGKGKYVSLDFYQMLDYLKKEVEQFVNDNYTSINSTYSSQCSNCGFSCVNCLFVSGFCTECLAGQYLDPILGKCYYACPKGKYSKFDLSSNKNYCLDCPPSCLECTNQTYCKSCASPFTLDNGQCYLNKTRTGVCADHEFTISYFCFEECPKGSSPNGQLCFCDSSCKSCHFDILNSQNFEIYCDYCVDTSYYLYNSICVQSCPNNTWKIKQERTFHRILHLNNQKQEKCYDNCPSGYLKLYENQTRLCVLSCPTGLTNYQGNCLFTACPEKFYYNPLKSVNSSQNTTLNSDSPQQEYYDLYCSSCNSNCKTCDGPNPNDCLTCDQNYYLQSNNMSTQFIQGLFLTNSQGTQGFIKAITDYYITFGAYCSSSCPPELVPLNQICGICFKSCKICYPSLKKFQNNCVLECPSNTFYDPIAKECFFNTSLELSILNFWRDNQHVSFMKDVKAELRIVNIDYSKQFNISALNCSIVNLREPENFHNLFVRSFNYVFVSYNFAVPTSFLEKNSAYNIICNVQLDNPAKNLMSMRSLKTFDLPNGSFIVNPKSGISLVDNFTVNYSDWNINYLNSDFYFNYDILIINNGESLSLSQDYQLQNVEGSHNFLFPYSNVSANVSLILHVYNDFTENTFNETITIIPQEGSTSILDLTINFSQMTIQNLNLMIKAFISQNNNLIAMIESNLFPNIEYLYKSINNNYVYTCDLKTDCNGHGSCLTQITNPKNKCFCNLGYGGFDCSWNSTMLEQTKNLVSDSLKSLEDNKFDISSNILKEILGNLALFPDAFNQTTFNQSLKLLKEAVLKGYTQNDTILTIHTLNHFLNVLKILKKDLNSTDLYYFVNTVKNILDTAVYSIGKTFGQSSQNNLTIITKNIKVKLQSLSFLGKSNNIIDNFRISLSENDPSANASIKVNLNKNSTFMNYYCDNYFGKLIFWSSVIFAENNDTNRFFTDILSFEIKSRADDSNLILLDSNYTLSIPKIAEVSSSASKTQANSLYNCLYYDNITRNWSSSGVSFNQESGDFIECMSNHLTDFSVQLTTDSKLIYDYLLYRGGDNQTDNEKNLFKETAMRLGIFTIVSLIMIGWYLYAVQKQKNTGLVSPIRILDKKISGSVSQLKPSVVKEDELIIVDLENVKL